MKIVKLQSENIKKLHAVEITPEGALITIGGKNGAGKSSVLDSIAYAMGGEKLVPSEPIRAGEAEAKIVVDLGDLIVTRRFKRDIVHAQECNSRIKPIDNVPAPYGCNCTPTFGDTTSTLTVTNKDGARYPSPQAVLDKLLGRLTFDPLAFARDDEKKQAETLRRLVNLDFSLLDAERAEAAARRAMLKKSHEIKSAQLLTMPFVKDAPPEEISMDGVSDEMRRAEELRLLAQDADREVVKHETAIANNKHHLAQQISEIELLNRQVDELNKKLKVHWGRHADLETGIQDATVALGAARTNAEAANAAVPDAAVIRAKIKDTEILNNAVRGNKRYTDAQAEIARLGEGINTEHEAIVRAEAARAAALAGAAFPVAGLGLGEDGVLFNGLPFAQAGSAEQVRVSVAIGIALNPKLKVLLIRNGNLLDKDSLRLVAEQAERASCQIWMEWVTEDAKGVAVMLEDGHVSEG